MEIVILPMSTEWGENTRPSFWAPQGPGAQESLGPWRSAFFSGHALQNGVWPEIIDNAAQNGDMAIKFYPCNTQHKKTPQIQSC